MTGRTIAAADAASIASDAAFLAANCACPTEVQARLRAWASELMAGCAAASTVGAVTRAAEDLLILANANAAFRLVAALHRDRGPTMLEIADLGGYCAAHAVLRALVTAAPLDHEDRAKVNGHILWTTHKLMRQLEAALSRM